MPKFIAYTRVSTAEQAKEGYSLSAQLKACREEYERTLAEYPDLEFVHREERGQSAWKLKFSNRPTGREVEAELQPGDHLCFTRLNRAFRKTSDCLTMIERWEKRGIIIHVCQLHSHTKMHYYTNDPVAKFILTVMAAVDELDSSMKATVTKEGKAEKAAQGRRDGGHPVSDRRMGVLYAPDDTMIPHWDEIRLFAWIAHQHANGMTYQGIADAIERRACWLEGKAVAEDSRGRISTFHSRTPYLGRIWHKKQVLRAIEEWKNILDRGCLSCGVLVDSDKVREIVEESSGSIALPV